MGKGCVHKVHTSTDTPSFTKFETILRRGRYNVVEIKLGCVAVEIILCLALDHNDRMFVPIID